MASMFEKADRISVMPIVADNVLGVSTHGNARPKPNGRYRMCFDCECGERRRLERADTIPPVSGVYSNETEVQGVRLRGVR